MSVSGSTMNDIGQPNTPRSTNPDHYSSDMVIYGAMTMRNRAKRKAEQEAAVSGSESERVGNTRRRRKKICKHDPYAQEIAQMIMDMYYWVTASTPIKAHLGNGLENTTWANLCRSEKSIFFSMLMFRLLNYSIVQTYYVADEYWQSVEVSHQQVFGTGYLTWEWTAAIRSYLYPAVFSFIFKILLVCGLDSWEMVIRLPRLVQTLAAALGDLYLYRLSNKIAGEKVAQWTLLCQVLSWFTFYCCTRTLSNSMESVLITMALSYYPWSSKSQPSESWKFLWLAALSVIIRPTAAVIWVPMCIGHIIMYKRRMWSNIVLYVVTVGIFLFISMRIDKSFYGEWIIVPWNFFNFNVTKRVSEFYGTHPWHWYFTQGLPFVLSTHVVPLCLSWRRCRNRVLQILFCSTILVYSCLAHKEFRFVLPMVPLAMHFCGYYITTLHQEITVEQLSEAIPSSKLKSNAKDGDSGLTTDMSQSDTPQSDSEQSLKPHKHKMKKRLLTPRTMTYVLLLGNVPMMLYFSTMHQRGPMDVMRFLHTEQQMKPNMSTLFLTPCHSTPYHSHIHTNMTMRFLTCEPNLEGVEEYSDEAEIFYANPVKWLKTEVMSGPGRHIYSHIVMFEPLETHILNFLQKGKYHRCAKYFYAHIIDDKRRSRNILVFCR